MPSLENAGDGRTYWRSLAELAESPEYQRLLAEGFPAAPDAASAPDVLGLKGLPGGNGDAGGTGGADADGFTRRRFLQVMGASIALAGLAGCRWPQEQILPFAHNPPEFVPGQAQRFATLLELAGVAAPLLVTSYDGRPIKVEGNPEHPASLGAADVFAQACVLELYDPDRSQRVTRRESGAGGAAGGADAGTPATWDDFLAFAGPHFAALRRAGGAGLSVLSEATSSPTVADLRGRLRAAYPQARWCEYEPSSRDHEREGQRAAFGVPCRAIPRLDRAAVIVDLDADLLGAHPQALRNARLFADGRRILRRQGNGAGHASTAGAHDAGDGGHGAAAGAHGGAHGGAAPFDPAELKANRLYVLEPHFTLTGSMADHRWAVPAGQVLAVAGALAAELFLAQGLPLPPGAEAARGALETFRRLAQEAGRPPQPHLEASGGAAARAASPFAAIPALARDLLAHRGAGLLAAGPRQAPAVHALVALMNAALGNAGATMTYAAEPERPAHFAALKELADDLAGGRVDTLLVIGGNPAFDAPGDLRLAEALPRARTRIRLSLYEDETSRLCHWHLPRAHALESWGDALAWDGTITLQQPLIEPLYAGWTPAQLLSLLVDEPALKPYELVRRTFGAGQAGGGAATVAGPGAAAGAPGSPAFEKAWREALEAGFVAGSAATAGAPAFAGDGLAALLGAVGEADLRAPSAGDLEIVFARDPKLLDGRFANNAWLQELPEPMTKLTWDNAALLEPATAAALGVETGDRLRLAHGGRDVELPALVTPGPAPWSVTVHYGQGRRAAGKVGDGVGADVYPLRPHRAPHYGRGLQVSRLGGKRTLAATQEHFAIDVRGMREREHRVHDLIRAATLAEYAAHPDFARAGEPPLHQLWDNPLDAAVGHRWGLAVDLNACTGCNACVVACQAENNIPVVGREQVTKGREMHWLRVDRYFSGPAEAPVAVHQPVACVQCENAPCEQVCPVAATVHSHEGLNVMVYNRCVGTRYCSNNCPYKARRFNFFNYHRELTDVEKMAYNPEVTVRARGVMEKCTYCVQRIEAGKIAAKNERRPLRDGEVTPACAQTCPTQAIVFGDLADPGSRVARLHADERAYGLLAELNVRPRTAYLARLTNPNPEIAEPADENGGH